MPSTVNGVGTRYFLKLNRQYEEAECPHCHVRTRLENYETWYCLCILFIPVLPLGKKQILGYCPSCTRHRIVNFREWEKIRNQAISETSEEFSESKDDPEAAMKMHGTLLAFQKGTEADRFAEIMLNRFATVPQVHFYLGACFERAGKADKANACFLRAFELLPDDLSYRRAAALVFIEQKKPDEARKLLDLFGPETQQFQPPLFFALGRSYQAVGRHADALDVFRMLLEKQPAFAKEKDFAKAVRASEKILGVEKPMLPPEGWYRNPAVLWGLATAAVLGAVGFGNYYIAQHRSLSVINGLKTPITVQIDNLPPIQIGGNSRQQLTIAEGAHKAVVTEPPGRFAPSDFDLRTSWWERFFRSPVFIADPSRTAAITWEQTVYSDNRAANDPDNKVELRVGQAYSSFPHADYHFQEFPQQLQAKAGSSITKSRVGIIHEPPTAVVSGAFTLGQDVNELDGYLQNHLIAEPDDSELLNTYVVLGSMLNKTESRAAFLESHLSDRPVRITWHRRYQDLFGRLVPSGDNKAKFAAMVAKYDEMLKQSPKDASLLYLRGRLEAHSRNSLPLFEQALAIEPTHAYAMAAKAFAYLSQGQNQEALEWYRKAVAVRPKDTEIAAGLKLAQTAAKDFAALELELREELKKSPDELDDNLELLKLLIETERSPQAALDFMALQGRLILKQNSMPQFGPIIVRSLELPYLYARGDFEALAGRAAQAGPDGKEFEFFAALERGKLQDVPESSLPMYQPYWHLCRAIVARELGDAVQAKASIDAARTMLEGRGGEEAVAAELLSQGANAKWDDIYDLSMQPKQKAILLLTLAQESPQLKTQCVDLAEKLNYSLSFPYYLLQKEIARMRK
jgi:tetratricopeptide (TPR) repeat protein